MAADGPGAQDGGEQVRRALELGPDDNVRWQIVEDLRRSGDVGTFNAAGALARSGDSDERLLGVDILAQFGGTSNERPFLEQTLDLLLPLSETETDLEVLRGVVSALGWQHDERAVTGLLRHLDHPAVAIRLGLAMSLPNSIDIAERPGEAERIVGALERLMTDADEAVRDWATFGLGQLDVDNDGVRDALLARADDEDEVTAGEALRALADRGDARAVPFVDALLRRLAFPNDSNAIDLAAEAAAGLRDPSLLSSLLGVHRTRAEPAAYLGWLDDAIDACGRRFVLDRAMEVLGDGIQIVVIEGDDECAADLVNGTAVIAATYGVAPTGALAALVASQRWLVEQLGHGAALGLTYLDKARNALDAVDPPP